MPSFIDASRGSVAREHVVETSSVGAPVSFRRIRLALQIMRPSVLIARLDPQFPLDMIDTSAEG